MDRYWIHLLVGHDLNFRHFAWLSVIAALGLSLTGIYAIDIGSHTAPPALSALGAAGGAGGEDAPDLASPPAPPIALSGLVLRQFVFLGVGIVAAALAAFPHYKHIRFVAWPLMWLALALLVFLLIPAVPTWLVRPRNGARAWIELGPVDFQPAELAKIAFILVLADYLRYRSNHRTVIGLIPPALIAFIPIALIMLQPDFGSASLFIPTLFAMLLTAGAKLKHLIAVVLIACAAGPAAYPLLKPYQKQRILGLIMVMKGDREAADDTTYQSFTAITLAGAGGITGQSDDKARALVRFNRLPERHNDMVFSVIANRFGLLGGSAVLGLFLMWFLGAFLTAALSKDPFARLVVIGCSAIIAAQMFINVGMNIGLVPIVGLTLPFVSYGGSSLLTVWAMTGLVFNVATRRLRRLGRPSFEFEE